MTTGKKKTTRLHSANSGGLRLSPGKKLAFKALLLLVLLGSLAYGICKGCAALNSIWQAQCIIRDPAQIEVIATPNISKNLVRDLFDIKTGANLAEIDFRSKRREILRKYPTFREIYISRNLPDKVKISVEERKPIARINCNPSRATWDSVDKEGVVFNFPLSATTTLPVIKERRQSAKRGEKLADNSLIGLKLIELTADRELANLALKIVDVSNDIYMIAYTREYDTIRLSWDYVKENGPHNIDNIRDALKNICKIMMNDSLRIGRQTYTVTNKGRITVAPYDKEPIK